MKNHLDSFSRILFGIALLVAAAACDLDVENPNSPTEEEVLTDNLGIISLAVGMQGQFASSIEDFVVNPALITDEWGTTTRALASYIALQNGVGLSSDFGVVEAPFANAYEVVRSANSLIDNVGQAEFGVGLETGIVVLSRLYKAMALGMIIQQYERVPIDVDDLGPVPADRTAVLAEVLSLLESARSGLASVSDADLAPFRTRVLGAGFDLPNTIDAMLARYYLIDGQYMQAIAAAERVDPGVLSVFRYTSTTQNPVYNLMFGLRYTLPLASFVTEAEAGDQRVDFWVDTAAPTVQGSDSLLQPPNHYISPTDPFPVYFPDEMKLIQAEAYARLGQLDLARDLINEVRTQASSAVDEPVANLPALTAADLATLEDILAQIAYERRYELYLQALRWEDMRRLGEFIAEEPTFLFLPLPRQECLANPSNPCG